MTEWHPIAMNRAKARQDGLLWEVRLPSGRSIYCSLDEFEQCFMRLDVGDLAEGMYDDEPSDMAEELFEAAAQMGFEDGIESDFSKGLTALITTGGVEAVRVIGNLLESTGANVAAEALRWLGLIEDAATREARLDVLLRNLHSPEACVRDGAILGLSFMDDRAALPLLRDALGRETSAYLRDDIMQVVEQLGEPFCPHCGVSWEIVRPGKFQPVCNCQED